MPSYHYIVKNIRGKIKSGILEAENKSDLAGIFRKDGYVLISATIEDFVSRNCTLSITLDELVSFLNEFIAEFT